ncbi:amidohydrolase [Ureibacillus sp. NPDC094379]
MVQDVLNITSLIESVNEEVIGWRRHLHMHPELSFQEENTAQFVYETLQSFGNLELSRPTKTSVVARLIGGQPGKVLGLRADMDALAIEEENDFEFSSKVPGVMHACGHDAHTAMLLGTAKILTSMKESIKGEVRFVFQHAEELHPGGAQEMVKAGVLDGVDCMVGLHLMSTIPVGNIVLNYGPVTANSDRFDIVIKGKGGHSSQPENAIDPLVIGAQVVTNLQQVVARNASPQDKLVLSVTNFHAGLGAYNVIPDSVKLSGSVRSFGEDVRKLTVTSMERIIKGITEAHGATYEFDYRYGYGSVMNDENITKLVEETILEQWEENPLLEMPPLMGGEDFSAFSNEVPSCFVMVGAGNEDKGIIYPHHHPRFTVDEDSFKDGVKLFVHTVKKILG